MDAKCGKLTIALQGRKIYKKLAWLNELPFDEAEYVFRECGGSPEWAHRMASSRPFPMLDQLFASAGELMAGSSAETRERVERRLAKLLER